ncbi:hypothetical protein ABID25_006327 [Mesorhizobium abyssinicae]
MLRIITDIASRCPGMVRDIPTLTKTGWTFDAPIDCWTIYCNNCFAMLLWSGGAGMRQPARRSAWVGWPM